LTRSDLLQLVEQEFPFLPRPPGSEISFHQDECAHCRMSRQGLMKYPGTATELPEAAIWFVRDEWSTLSAKAAAWILPSYLRYVLTNEREIKDRLDAPSISSWLIFSLAPLVGDAADADETRLRFSLLTPGQAAALLAILDYWKNHAPWREWNAEEIDAAIAFVLTMTNNREGMS
jgi:hypothetical protein